MRVVRDWRQPPIDIGGWTALIAAGIGNRNPDMIDPLIKNGAEIDAQEDDGMTALMLAASLNENPEVMLRLLKFGANAKLKADLGDTAFDLAAENRHIRGTKAFYKLREATYK